MSRAAQELNISYCTQAVVCTSVGAFTGSKSIPSTILHVGGDHHQDMCLCHARSSPDRMQAMHLIECH